MKHTIALVTLLSLFAMTACDKPNKAAGEEQGLGISGAASGKSTRDKPGSDREGETRPASPQSSTPSDKSK